MSFGLSNKPREETLFSSSVLRLAEVWRRAHGGAAVRILWDWRGGRGGGRESLGSAEWRPGRGLAVELGLASFACSLLGSRVGGGFGPAQAALNAEGAATAQPLPIVQHSMSIRRNPSCSAGVDAAAGSALLGSIAAVGNSYASVASDDETSSSVRAAELAVMAPCRSRRFLNIASTGLSEVDFLAKRRSPEN